MPSTQERIRDMDKITVLKQLDEAIENFKKDMALFSEDSPRPATEKDLHALSVMVLNALSDVKKAFE